MLKRVEQIIGVAGIVHHVAENNYQWTPVNGFSNLVQGFQQIHLFEDTTELTNLYQAMDKIRFRYGVASVKRAVGLGGARLS